ncbi:MAG: DNA-directed RNA polymerase subunit alpha [Bacteroidales bacterium]|nr:DNA-directed RNA polymerase subunit alpha [Bacteroidales bacterium]
MAILAFQKPEKVIMLEANDFYGKFEFRPLEPGYGVTIGNALRRILLSSLEGFAITTVRIAGVEHEFSTVKGITEDVTDILLNLKQVRFRRQIDSITNEKVIINIKNQKQFKANDINGFLNSFQVLNPEIVICNMDPSVNLSLEVTIDKGRGYVPADENKPVDSPVGVIPIDAIFTPIKNVRYTIENFRVEQKTDYEKLIFEIWTDGSIDPTNALKETAKILIHHFALFSDEKISIDFEQKAQSDELDETSLHIRQLLKTKLTDLDLSVRALNCLKAAEVETLGELVTFNRNDLLKFRNFGKKSLNELDDLVKSKNLTFGMNISKYKLDKE